MWKSKPRGICAVLSEPTTTCGLPSYLLQAHGVLPRGCEVSYVSPFQNSLILLKSVYVMQFPLPDGTRGVFLPGVGCPAVYDEQ